MYIFTPKTGGLRVRFALGDSFGTIYMTWSMPSGPYLQLEIYLHVEDSD